MTQFHSSILTARYSSSHPVLFFLSDLILPTDMPWLFPEALALKLLAPVVAVEHNARS